MKNAKFFSASIAAVLTLGCTVSLADGASSASAAQQGTVVAQSSQNPQNDPDVARGMRERQEQERQRQIQACIARQEAGISNETVRAQRHNDIRNDCASGVTLGGGFRG